LCVVVFALKLRGAAEMVTIEQDWVVFTFYRPGASRVCVAGDFNGWKTGDVEMVDIGGGNWEARLRLAPGEFRFRYCADGEWFADYAACGLELGRFGMDSVVVVPLRSSQRSYERVLDEEPAGVVSPEPALAI
jgi:1,4-alpha-glucan branching enzyme